MVSNSDSKAIVTAHAQFEAVLLDFYLLYAELAALNHCLFKFSFSVVRAHALILMSRCHGVLPFHKLFHGSLCPGNCFLLLNSFVVQLVKETQRVNLIDFSGVQTATTTTQHSQIASCFVDDGWLSRVEEV